MGKQRIRRVPSIVVPGIIANLPNLSAEAKIVYGALTNLCSDQYHEALMNDQEHTGDFVTNPHDYIREACGLPPHQTHRAITELVDYALLSGEPPLYFFIEHGCMKNSSGEFVLSEREGSDE